jgi:hypothetical protein
MAKRQSSVKNVSRWRQAVPADSPTRATRTRRASARARGQRTQTRPNYIHVLLPGNSLTRSTQTRLAARTQQLVGTDAAGGLACRSSGPFAAADGGSRRAGPQRAWRTTCMAVAPLCSVHVPGLIGAGRGGPPPRRVHAVQASPVRPVAVGAAVACGRRLRTCRTARIGSRGKA